MWPPRYIFLIQLLLLHAVHEESMESNSWKFVMGISLSKTPIKLAKPLHNMPPLQELKIQHSTHFSFQNKPWQETFSVNTCACMWKSDVHAIPGTSPDERFTFPFPRRWRTAAHQTGVQDVAKENEGIEATVDLKAIPSSSWLVLSFSPFLKRPPDYKPCRS